jgi:uncharacterized protein YdeI (BOF family)
MHRARRAGLAALILLIALAAVPARTAVLLAEVTWATSSLVLSEVQTGGASASDEFVEIANQGATAVDLNGLELVYATASGSTVTRKAVWDVGTVLLPGRRYLLANAAGIHLALGDATYTGGFAATSGALALRVVGGTVIDAIGWGDAVNPFVEGTAAAAPPAGSSAERRPGGAAGNGVDTNQNDADWFTQANPSPQGLTSPPVPGPSPSPTPGGTPTPTPVPTPNPTPTPVPTPGPTPTPSPLPSPTPTPSPLPSPTPTPAQSPVPIASARALVDGTTVTVQGVLTTRLGAIDSERGGFIQDETGGLALYLDAAVLGSWPAGTTITVRGTIASRFALRTLKCAEPEIERGPDGDLPAASSIATGEATESHEGSRVSVTGTIDGAPDQLTDGLGITIDDGSGPVRAVIGTDAASGQAITSGQMATVSGPLGQRDSSGTGAAGYRIHATMAGELTVAAPTPTPTPTPSPTPSPTPTPSTTPSPTPTPDPAPTPGETQSIAAARGQAIGARVTVVGVVTAEAGRLGTASLSAIADESGGIAVRLPAGAGSPQRGTRIQVTGTLAAPYGQLEVRAASDGVLVLDAGQVPDPLPLGAGTLDESLEGRLVVVQGTVAGKPRRSSGGDLTITLERPGLAPIKAIADASSLLGTDSFVSGRAYRLTGVVGQRASKKGAQDGYRICLRDAGDVVALAGVAADPGLEGDDGSSAEGTSSAQLAAPRSIMSIRGLVDARVVIEGVVTVPATVLDNSRRRTRRT